MIPSRLSPREPDCEATRRLLSLWAAAFGEQAVAVRTVIERSLREPALFAALERLIDGFAEHPHPEHLRDWLRRIENRPLPAAGRRRSSRFTRVGHRWALVPVALPEAARGNTVDPEDRTEQHSLTTA